MRPLTQGESSLPRIKEQAVNRLHHRGHITYSVKSIRTECSFIYGPNGVPLHVPGLVLKGPGVGGELEAVRSV